MEVDKWVFFHVYLLDILLLIEDIIKNHIEVVTITVEDIALLQWNLDIKNTTVNSQVDFQEVHLGANINL